MKVTLEKKTMLDIRVEYIDLDKSMGYVVIEGKEVDAIIELITKDMLIANNIKKPSESSIELYKPYVKRILTFKTAKSIAKYNANMIKRYISEESKSRMDDLLNDSMPFASMYECIRKIDFNDPSDKFIEEFGFEPRLNKVLKSATIYTLNDLKRYMNYQNLSDIRGLGKKSIDCIVSVLNRPINIVSEDKEKESLEILKEDVNSSNEKEVDEIDEVRGNVKEYINEGYVVKERSGSTIIRPKKVNPIFLKNLYDTINELFPHSKYPDLYYTDEQIEELKKDPSNTFFCKEKVKDKLDREREQYYIERGGVREEYIV